MELIQLDIVGLSYSQTQTGAYALVLGELTGNRRLPIIIGSFEAKAIAVALESDIKPERPITHDLFTTFCKGYDIRVQKVVISSIKDGIFSSIIYCVDNKERARARCTNFRCRSNSYSIQCSNFTYLA